MLGNLVLEGGYFGTILDNSPDCLIFEAVDFLNLFLISIQAISTIKTARKGR
jgi:hypothetical protein